MSVRNGWVRAGWLVLVPVLAVLASGCGEKVIESRQTEYLLADPLERRTILEQDDHLRRGDAKVPRAPLHIGGPPGAQRSPIPVMSLLKVRIDLLPPVDCERPPEWLMASSGFAFPQPVADTQLASLGEIVRTAEIWVVPSSAKGAYVDIAPDGAAGRAIAMEASYAGDRPDFRSPVAVAVEFGPEWLGLPLRQIGTAGALLFPPSQDCAKLIRSSDDWLPTRAVAYGPFDPGATAADSLKIPADVPFIARIVDICPVRLQQRDEFLEVEGRYFWERTNRWRYSATIVGACGSGNVTFSPAPLIGYFQQNGR